MDFSRDLYVSLINWTRFKAPSFQMSALHVFEYSEQLPKIDEKKSSDNSKKSSKDIKAIAFAGSYKGEIARFYIYEKDTVPVSLSFGHSSKIVEFALYRMPIFLDGIASLSVDGTICLWNVADGICLNKFENILPNGCQHFAISRKAIELCVVSGAFAPVYVVNIQEGKVIQQIHPCNSFISGISFFSTKTCAWLFTIDSTGCATYTTLTPTTATSHKIRLIAPEKGEHILIAQPNFDYSYLFAATCHTIYIINLTTPEFSYHHYHTDNVVLNACWIDDYTVGFIQMDGHFSAYEFPKPPNDPKFSNEYVISKLIDSASDSISSSLKSSDLNEPDTNINVKLLNPFSNDIPEPLWIHHSPERRALENKDVTVITDGNAELFNPLISGYRGKLVIGFDDSISVVDQDFEEYSLSSAFKKTDNKSVTAQCFLKLNDKVVILVEGTMEGKVNVRFLSQNRKKIKLRHSHKGKVVALYAFQNYLFTSGDDCFVHIYSVFPKNSQKKFHLVQTLCHFTSPVISFCKATRETGTNINNCIFCVTRENVVSMIDVTDMQNKRVMSGHDGRVKRMWLHPPSKMLLIECNSLYFWSLVSSNLESIITGYKKKQFLDSLGDSYIPISQMHHEKNGMKIYPLAIGSTSFETCMVNVKKISKIVKAKILASPTLPIHYFDLLLPNFPLIYEILPEKVRRYIKKHSAEVAQFEQPTPTKLSSKVNTSSPNISLNQKPSSIFTSSGNLGFSPMTKVVDISKMKSKFTLSFVGSNMVPTLILPSFKITKKMRWKISPYASSIILSTRTALSAAFMSHIEFKDKWRGLFKLNTNDITKHISNFHSSSIFHILRFVFNCPNEVHAFLLDLISSYPLDLRREWLERLKNSAQQYPYYYDLFTFIGCSLAETMLKEISHSQLNESLKELLETAESDEVGPYAREMIARKFDEYKKAPILSKEKLKSIINKVASNAGKNDSDRFSLSIFFKKIGELCLDIASQKAQKGEQIAAAFLNEIASVVSEKVNISNSEFSREMEILLIGLERLPQKDIDKIYKNINQNMQWFSFSAKTHSVAYGEANGNVGIIILNTKKNSFMKTHIEIAKSMCDHVEFDPSGTLLLVQSSKENLTVVLTITTVKSNEDKDKDKLVISTTQSFRKQYKSLPAAKWRSPKYLEIEDPETKEKNPLNFP